MALSRAELFNQLQYDAAKRGELHNIAFELTSRCNLQCKMCYVRKLPNDHGAQASELNAAQWIGIAEEARDAGVLMLSLTGGEVFLRRDFREIYEHLAQMGFVLQILSNATLINRDTVEWLAKIPPYKIHVTLYGASKETYEKVTGHGNGLEKTLAAIDMLIEAGIETVIRTTVVQGNMKDIDQLQSIAQDKGLALGLVDYISPQRKGVDTDPLANRLSPEELMAWDIKARAVKGDEKAPISTDNYLDGVLPPPDDFDFNPTDAFRCLGGKCAAWITADGSMYTCGLLDKPVAYPLEVGLARAWEQIKEGCRQIPPCKECLTCRFQPLCGSCPARLRAETGSCDKPAPYLCEIANQRYNYLKKNPTGL